jgi:hypothetical protein
MDIELVLEVECHNFDEVLQEYCDGGFFWHFDDMTNKNYTVRCTKCHGLGYIPTELGEQLLDFFRRHGK